MDTKWHIYYVKNNQVKQCVFNKQTYKWDNPIEWQTLNFKILLKQINFLGYSSAS